MLSHVYLFGLFLILGSLSSISATRAADGGSAAESDPYLWLEDVTGQRALDWAKARNAVATRELEGLPYFAPMRERVLKTLNSDERIPGIRKYGPCVYNFWRDAAHPRGVWRRTTLDEYRKASPAWETVFDLDAFAAEEKENWVWHGAEMRYPAYDRALISLSHGGGDAEVVREFDLGTKAFLKDGFSLPESKSSMGWRDPDHVYVGTDFGPGTMTSSGYPRIVKEWARGTPLSAAKTVFEGRPEDVNVAANVHHDRVYGREFITRAITFFTSDKYVRRGDAWVKLDVPADCDLDTFQDYILITLHTDWTVGGRTYPAGALLAANWDLFLGGGRAFDVLFTPEARTSLDAVVKVKDALILATLVNVDGRLCVVRPEAAGWKRDALPAPEFGRLAVEALDRENSDEFLLTVAGFLTPSSLYLGSIDGPGREMLKKLPSFFDTSGLEVTQHEAISADGTRVPYFQVSRKGLALDGGNPTILNGYGGFQISMTPGYNPGVGACWLEPGGVYVLANIRGGGEFGPGWHNAALKGHRQRAYDDFIAVAEDLIARKVTSQAHLGITGRSNGGLLMGVMLTERPDLFKAVDCGSPLLDMKRYSHLLAGASWIGEYGDPDQSGDWAYISKYSPYQNVFAGKQYPRVLFTTSTRDDRVHPGHARKMAAKMLDQGHDVLFYENIEGGHAASANNEEQAFMTALSYAFFREELGLPGSAGR